MNLLEKKIRENLASNLSIISPNLNLVKEEYYLENPFGAKGYIDILATDSDGDYVIIEIKRSNQTARQALNEILKYPFLLKHKLHVKTSEIKIIIVSTTWHELIAPFSEFYNISPYHVDGFNISVDVNGKIISIDKVKPIALEIKRNISRNHFVYLYNQNEECYGQIGNIEKKLNTIGIKDFLLLINKNESYEGHLLYPYEIYLAFQQYNEEYYINIIQNILESQAQDESEFLELYNDILERKKDMNQEEFMMSLENEILLHINKDLKCDSAKISYPEKLDQALSNGVLIEKIIRVGTFQEDIRLSVDKILVEELLGYTGKNHEIYYGFYSTSSKGKLDETKQELELFLKYNPYWKQHMYSLFEDYKDKVAMFSISIYQPTNILEGMYNSFIHKLPITLPNFTIIIDLADECETHIYYGIVKWDGTGISLSTIIDKYYGDKYNYLLNRYNQQINLEVMKELGFSYVTELIVLREDEKEEYGYGYNGYKHDRISKGQFKDAYNFIEEEVDFIKGLVDFIKV